MLNSHQLNVLHIFEEKTLQDQPFQGLTPRFEESKSHIEEAGTIENIWKYIHTPSSNARHQELAQPIIQGT